MHIVLDLHCKTNPDIDISTIAYEVFQVKKKEKLYGIPSLVQIVSNELVGSKSSTGMRVKLLASAVTGSTGALTDFNQKN